MEASANEGVDHARARGALPQLRGDERRDLRGGRGRAVRALATGWPVVAALAALAAVMNSLTVQADHPDLASWKAWVLEVSSPTVLALLAWMPWLATTAAAPEGLLRGPRAALRVLGAHCGALLAFSGLHVAGMFVLRRFVFALAGELYDYKLVERFGYEFTKDVFAYAIFVSVFWLALRIVVRGAPAETRVFDIQDGQRLIRAPLSDILAVAAAGNYVEFFLADGRRPLMRATLSGAETDLAAAGFVRTHRAWLVNAARMTGLERQRSGDWLVRLEQITAPVSRRSRGALARLRAAEA